MTVLGSLSLVLLGWKGKVVDSWPLSLKVGVFYPRSAAHGRIARRIAGHGTEWIHFDMLPAKADCCRVTAKEGNPTTCLGLDSKIVSLQLASR